ncbi:MAG: DUF4440 domain-containing protein [Alphaproteobacteria bacterium]|nr:DUF4440 domain-containing protein [Alphaproteobacteria bacterium]
MAASDDIANGAAAEIRELHVFLEGWLGGKLPRDVETYAGFASMFEPGFVMIGPNGVPTRLDDLLPGLESGHGMRAGTAPPFAIRIENVAPLHIWNEQALVTYEEWQDLPDGTTARQSSVLFRRAPEARNGVRWLHLHETWIEGLAPPA